MCIRDRVGALEEGDLRPENVARIAKDLSVTEQEVIDMNRRLAGSDASLNATVGSDGEGATQWQDWLEDEDSDQAGDYEARDEFEIRHALLMQAMSVLNDREKDVLAKRRLADEPVTLEDPVSYTHLDVYKRQLWRQAAFAGKAAGSGGGLGQ